MRRVDLVGQRFGRLIVTEYAGSSGDRHCNSKKGTNIDFRGE